MAVAIILSTAIHAEIIEIQKIAEIERLLPSHLKSSDWILFDIDYTLTEPIDPALNMHILKLDMPRFLEELETFTEKQKELVPILMNTQVPSKLTEPCASDLIKKLQESAATILGFTAADTASLPDVGAITSWRRNELLRLGIDFKPPHRASPIPTTIVEFTQSPSFRGTFPVYIDGILYLMYSLQKQRFCQLF